MTDLINQGKGPVLQIWGTSDNNKLHEIKSICDEANEDFYNPPIEFRNWLLTEMKSKKILDEIKSKGE